MKYGTILRLSNPQSALQEFEKLKNKGFDCCQLVYKPQEYTIADAEIIKTAVMQSGIKIQAFFAGFRDNHTKWNLFSDFKDAGINSKQYGEERVKFIKQAASFCGMIGIENMLIHAGFVANDPFCEDYIRMRDIVFDVADFAKRNHVNLLLETGGESPITLLRLIEDVGTDNVFVNIDTANIIMYGFGNPVDAVFTLKDYIKSVHIKDGLPPVNTKELGKETELFEGFVDFKRFFALIQSFKINVPFIIEREIQDGKTEEMLSDLLNKVKSMITE
ncbi:MAG: hypothetical protein E7562_00090 [Ruminococcaceae bacterium]|nr:hypothetical protein [Oscillospiraceae bacterium]